MPDATPPVAGQWIEFTAAGKTFRGLVVWNGNGVHYVAVVGYNGLMHVRSCRVAKVERRKPEPVSFTNA
jgi:hypothetical protein